MPVCIGSLTGWRPTMPGACTSMRRVSVVLIGPLPSSGSPRALTTRPSRASPTGHGLNAPGGLDGLLLLDAVDLAQDDGTDGVLVEVQGETQGPVLELEQLVHRGTGQPGDPGDAVTDLDDAPDLLGAHGRGVVLDVALQRLGDLTGVNRELCHHSAPSVWSFELWLRPNPAGSQPVGAKCSRSASIRPRAVASTWRSPIRINAPLSSDSSTSICNSTGAPARVPSDSVNSARWAVVDRRRRPHAGDAPAPGLGGQFHQVVQGADDVPGPAPGHGVAGQRQAGRRHLPLEQLRDETLAGRHVQVAVGRARRGSAGVDFHDAGEAEQVVLERLQLGGGHVLVHRRGEAADALAGLRSGSGPAPRPALRPGGAPGC